MDKFNIIRELFLANVSVCPICLKNSLFSIIICESGHEVCSECYIAHKQNILHKCAMCKCNCLYKGVPNLSYNNMVSGFLDNMGSYLPFEKDEIVEIEDKNKWFEAIIKDIDYEELVYLVKYNKKIRRVSIHDEVIVKKNTYIPKWRAAKFININDFLEFYDFVTETWTHCQVVWKYNDKLVVIYKINDELLTQIVCLTDYNRLAPLNSYLSEPQITSF